MVKIATVIATVIALFNNLASADPAIRITGLGCGLYDGNGNSVFTLKSRTVITHSENGNVVCQATVTPSTAGKARTFNFKNTNVFCCTLAGCTPNWQETISASGQATLTCHV
ncbi:hypothetical protein FOMG_02382 [Fusarium oxysporum f. sp. melonis 26406]|uniref:Uncharacterized protein n=1 Tax=Fusarium oxysporum f. sp. melonis 26406 TaxID=1089452 RepID=X0AH05_FUSOX|nr:hypothetical protein FOMG_02382 [Fusarium oxysporum f. sp. melonis 26406]